MKSQTYDWFHRTPKIQKKIITSTNFTYRKTLEVLAQEIGNRKNINILDYGCGVGTIDFYLANQGYPVLGVDVSPRAIEVARKSAQTIGVSSKAKFELVGQKTKRKFDIVLCSEVIEHIKDDQKLFLSISSVLKKDGYLILSTPSLNAPLFRLGLAMNFDKRVGHLRRYNLIELTSKIIFSGFNIKKVIKTEGIIRNSLFLFPSLGWIVRFLKGPLSNLVTFLDDLTVPLFGESNFIVIAKKI